MAIQWGGLLMNRLADGIARVCRERLFEEKWLLAPSRRVGHQWLESVARSGQPVINVRVETMKTMALALAAQEMAAAGLALLSDRAGATLVDGLWGRHKKRGGYLFSLDRSMSLSEAVYATLQSVRLSGLSAEQLVSEHFEVPAKAQELATILLQYEKALGRRRLADYADVLRMATDAVRKRPEALPSDMLVLLPTDQEMCALERNLLESLPAGKLVALPVDETCRPPAGTKSDAAILGWLLRPADAPMPAKDGSASIFHAVGEVNEVREVLRRCLATNTRLDDVELLYTESQTYVPLIYELAERLGSDKQTDQPGLKVTFAEGIPVRYARPGRALAAWLEWMANGYPQATLIRMIQDGLLNVSQDIPGSADFATLAELLRSVPIGFGRDRYLALLDEEAASEDLRASREVCGEDGEADEPRREVARQRAQGLRCVRAVVARLLAASPTAEPLPQRVLEAAAGFVRNLTRIASEFDVFSRDRLAEEIEAMAALLSESGEATSLDAMEYLGALPDEVRVCGSGPRPGSLHAAHVLAGGQSGRGRTFIVGLDDHRLPGAGLQDPILLDSERAALSPDLRTAADDLRAKLEGFARLLARLRGTVTFSFSSQDLIEDREMFPGPVVLAAWRILSGNREGDQSALVRWLGPPASFVPACADGALDITEWWTWRACGSLPVQDPVKVLSEAFPHLGRGILAAASRGDDEFSVFDGLVEEAGHDGNPTAAGGPILSASALELLGKCPLGYFFKQVLRVEPPEDLEVDPNRWLDPLDFGVLLHDVFCRFMRELQEKDSLPPVYKRDHRRLREILFEQIIEYKRLCPPPNESAYVRQRRELEKATHIFLTEEEIYCRDHTPLFMEAAIGMRGGGTLLDTPEPVSLMLPDKGRIRVRGRIDRVDRVGGTSDSLYAIWDYKSGSAWKHRKKPPFWQGRVLQHIVYLYMARERLRQVDKEAEVATVGYFFPGPRGRGERVEYLPEALADGLHIIQNLCRLVAGGAFIATDASDDCGYCDYLPICGDAVASAGAAGRKIENGAGGPLAPMRALRGYDDEE